MKETIGTCEYYVYFVNVLYLCWFLQKADILLFFTSLWFFAEINVYIIPTSIGKILLVLIFFYIL